MKMTVWPLRKRNKPSESEVALAKAQENLARIQQRSAEIQRVATATKKLVERNRFAERIEGIMGG